MKTVSIKGIGKVSVKPDLIVITMRMESEDKEYDKATELAAEKIELLSNALAKVGFEKTAIKTTNFNVRTQYESVKDKNGSYKNVFKGYVCNHDIKVEFDIDTKKLAKVLSAVSVCLAKPEFSIAFTVKDSSAVSAELLKSAAQNAKEKAEILCAGCGVKLGELQSINYGWGEPDVRSDTDYRVDGRCMLKAESCLSNIDIQPEDIKVNDAATFVWEII